MGSRRILLPIALFLSAPAFSCRSSEIRPTAPPIFTGLSKASSRERAEPIVLPGARPPASLRNERNGSVPRFSQTEVEVPPVALLRIYPIYPTLAQEQGWEGTVRLLVSVSDAGSIEKIEVMQSSGYEILDEAALTALKRWLFRPATRNGRHVSATLPLNFCFKLEE